MTDDVKLALAWADMRTTDLWGVVRSSVGTPLVFVDPDHVREVALDRLADELRRMDGQRCETCKQELHGECRLTLTDDVDEHGDLVGAKMMPCAMFGNGCRAYEPKA